jgi:predicted  nucleic acid-binding Zn-ribbon protein
MYTKVHFIDSASSGCPACGQGKVEYAVKISQDTGGRPRDIAEPGDVANDIGKSSLTSKTATAADNPHKSPVPGWLDCGRKR